MVKFYSMVFMAVLYVLAGAWHFVKPQVYLKIMPPYIPAPLAMVFLSGFAEILCGIGLLIPSLQFKAAWAVIFLLIAVFPANYYMYQKGGAAFEMSEQVLFWRMPSQLVLIAWAYWYTN